MRVSFFESLTELSEITELKCQKSVSGLRAVDSTIRKPACMPYGQEGAPVGGGRMSDVRFKE